MAVRVPDEVDANGFVAGEGKWRPPVAWDGEGGGAHGPLVPGETLRVRSARCEHGVVRLSAKTEAFRREPAPV